MIELSDVFKNTTNRPVLNVDDINNRFTKYRMIDYYVNTKHKILFFSDNLESNIPEFGFVHVTETVKSKSSIIYKSLDDFIIRNKYWLGDHKIIYSEEALLEFLNNNT
jgi:hypothetical protein